MSQSYFYKQYNNLKKVLSISKKQFYLVLFFPIFFLLFHCAEFTPVDPVPETPSILEFNEPLPADDTVMIDEVYTVSLGGVSDNMQDTIVLFFTGVPQGYTYDLGGNEFIWKADKDIFNADSGPFTITAGLTNTRDTIYHTWTLYVKKHEWEFMFQNSEMVEFAAYNSSLVFRLCERKDSVVNGIGYHTGFIQRSYDGGVSWEVNPVYSRVLQRFFEIVLGFP